MRQPDRGQGEAARRRHAHPARLPRPHPTRHPREGSRAAPFTPSRTRHCEAENKATSPPCRSHPAFPRPLSLSPGPARARSKCAATLPPQLRPPPAAAGAAGSPAARGPPLGSQLSLKRDGGVGRFGWGSPLKAIMISSALLPPRNRRSSQRPKPPRCPQPRSDNPLLPGPTLFLC